MNLYIAIVYCSIIFSTYLIVFQDWFQISVLLWTVFQRGFVEVPHKSEREGWY